MEVMNIMKMENGKSIIPLLLLVVVITIVIIFGVKYLSKEVYKKELETIQTDMLLIQAKVKIIAENNHMNPEENELKGEIIEDETLDEVFNIEDITKYYKWDENLIREIGLEEVTLKENEYYAVNYEEEEVIYSKGYTDEKGNIFYKLTDIKDLQKNNVIDI